MLQFLLEINDQLFKTPLFKIRSLSKISITENIHYIFLITIYLKHFPVGFKIPLLIIIFDKKYFQHFYDKKTK